jgi:hypothetical protein
MILDQTLSTNKLPASVRTAGNVAARRHAGPVRCRHRTSGPAVSRSTAALSLFYGHGVRVRCRWRSVCAAAGPTGGPRWSSPSAEAPSNEPFVVPDPRELYTIDDLQNLREEDAGARTRVGVALSHRV